MRNNRFIALFIIAASLLFSNVLLAADVTIIDSRHYSNVFGEMRNFRIFLPPGYYDNPQKKYPVIYFLHGWSQRYFGGIGEEYAGFDKGQQNNGDNISSFVSRNEVIVVKSDGYNRSQNEPYDKRPYNVSPVETYRQFPIYFPELVSYIDGHYNTLADRGHRAITGLSMGGFMTFWIGGKYPDMFCAAGSFCGSPEFEVGPRAFPVEYRHIDMYKNYGGMNVRLHYGDKDFIRSYHEDMNRIWPRLMDNYISKIYDAEHSTCGLGEMFDSFIATFRQPPQKPAKWDHTDVYPAFSVWDYQITSDRIATGFTVLENVDNRGFRCSVMEYVPDGRLQPNVHLSLTTAPVYEKNQPYTINDMDQRTGKSSQYTVRSDNNGRLMINIDGSTHEIGINKKNDKPNISIASVEIENMNWAMQGREVKLAVKLLNKGLTAAKNIKAKLSAARSNVSILQNQSSFGDIAINDLQSGKSSFAFNPGTDTAEIIQFRLDIKDDNKNEWSQLFDLPVRKDVAEFKDFEIADGKTFTVTNSGIDLQTVLLGSGNGDGIANPGESVIILVKDKNKLWRTKLSFSDKYLNPFDIKTRRSDDWSKFDHVGATMKYDITLIASDCPVDHQAELFAEYWIPEYPYHIIKQGSIKINIKGEDKTPPVIAAVQMQGDNTIEARIYDGSAIKNARATLLWNDDPEKLFEVELNDDGKNGDRAGQDNIFSFKIPYKKFGLYRVIIEAADSSGNKTSKEMINALFEVH